tara:strand:+ start:382 stop:594 length:213 start_codon:yes stop_codon:yes gene_type:complete
MVLGFIIYESLDLMYNATKITINVLVGTYNWYYDIKHYEPIHAPEDRLLLLEDKIDKLTKQLEMTNMKKD